MLAMIFPVVSASNAARTNDDQRCEGSAQQRLDATRVLVQGIKKQIMTATWKSAVLSALQRYSRRHGSLQIERGAFLSEELPAMIAQTTSAGRTPAQTVSRVLQELRDEGRLDLGPWQAVFYCEFDGRRSKRLVIKVLGG